MKQHLKFAAVVLTLALGCSSEDAPMQVVDAGPGADANNNGLPDATISFDGGDMGADAMVMVTIPDPGNATNAEWTDVEPNDDPSQAVPIGILEGPIWMGFAMPYTTINNNTDVDYFVFKTGAANTLDNIYMSICWDGSLDLLDLYLYEVVNSAQGNMVRSAASTDTSCETIIDFGEGSSVLTAETTYLLEVRAAPGLELGAASGLYMA